jgi:5'-nucleotidase
MASKRTILLTNDDGYFAPGINALYSTLAKKHRVFLVAPDREQSASSHSLTLNRPLRVHKISAQHYATDGTPTDCVMLAIHLLFKKEKPDMIISGINHGANMGDDVTYSGTVAAAIEGAILKIPSLAVSMAHWVPGMSMVRGAQFVSRLVASYENFDLEPSTFLNVNLPPDHGRGYSRFEFTSQGFRTYRDIVVHKTDPRGKPYFWIGGRPRWRTAPGTDFAAVAKGYVSITPMKLDFTDLSSLERLRQQPPKSLRQSSRQNS